MKIDYQKLHDIITTSKSKFSHQETRLFWETPRGEKEVTFEEKRFIAIVESMNMKLQLGLEIDYGE